MFYGKAHKFICKLISALTLPAQRGKIVNWVSVDKDCKIQNGKKYMNLAGKL